LLPASEARFRAVFAHAGTGIILEDPYGRVIDVNTSFAEMLGYSIEEIRGHDVRDFIHPDEVPRMMAAFPTMIEAGDEIRRYDRRYLHRDGHVVLAELTASFVRDDHGAPIMVIVLVVDITQRHELQRRLRHQAMHDPLTGLPNRILFQERLHALFATPGSRIGLCFLDLDRFKAVNDRLGHEIGDGLLVGVAGRLAGIAGTHGHLVARMGGDEFVVLVEHPGDEDSLGVELSRCAQMAMSAVRRPIRLGNHSIMVSASAGVVQRADVGAGAAELMKAADTTLYWAKKDGRNRLALFDADRHHRDVGRFALSAQMPDALARGEFTVAYQPLVRLSDFTVVGVEALVRWDLPSGERLGPDLFIPLAEETGLIVELGRWVLAETCRQAAEWRVTVPEVELFVSVNLAARQVREPGMVADVASILAETGWPATSLQMELTESDLMGTTGESLEALHELADMGVQIAIDDFGTGYSNLAYLRHLPVHALKLAGRFVTGSQEAGTDEVDVEVAMLLIRLAHVLSLSVTAESVETAAQVAQLREVGCDIGQGWYFSAAVDPASITELLRRRGRAPVLARSGPRGRAEGAKIGW